MGNELNTPISVLLHFFKGEHASHKRTASDSVVTGVLLMRQAPLTGSNDARGYLMPTASNGGSPNTALLGTKSKDTLVCGSGAAVWCCELQCSFTAHTEATLLYEPCNGGVLFAALGQHAAQPQHFLRHSFPRTVCAKLAFVVQRLSAQICDG